MADMLKKSRRLSSTRNFEIDCAVDTGVSQYTELFMKYLDQKIAECILTGEDLKNPCNEIPQASFASIGFPGTHVVDTIEELMEYGFDRATAEKIMNPPPLRVYRINGHIDQMLTDRVPPQYRADLTACEPVEKPQVITLRFKEPVLKGEWFKTYIGSHDTYVDSQFLGDAYEARLQFDPAKGPLGGWVVLENSVALKPVNAPVDSKALREDLAERAAYVGLSVEQYVEVMRAAQEKLNR